MFWSLDGIPLSKSSKLQIWPLMVHLLTEGQPVILITSIWVGSNKPSSNEYLESFVKECNFIHDIGVTYNIDDGVKHTKVHTVAGIMDLPAKSYACSFSRHNSVFGCSLCLKKSTYY